MTRWGLALGIVLFGAASVRAQPVDCASAYAEAETRYVERAFSAVVSSLAPCLDGTRATIPAYRLVALAELRQGLIVDAKLTILRMLTLSPTYRANRIQDPPTYVALVETVRDEIAAFATAELQAAVAAQGPWDRVVAQPPHLGEPRGTDAPDVRAEPVRRIGIVEDAPIRQSRWSLGVWGGTSSYGGERGRAASGVAEFFDNAGLAGGLGLEVGLTPAIALFLDAEAGHFPTLPTRKGPDEQFDAVDSFAAFAQFTTAGIRARPRLGGPVSAVVSAGGGVGLGSRDGLSVGGLLTVGGGVEVDVSRPNTFFVTGHATFVGPARALDGAALPSDPLDLFSGLRLGIRTRL
ncbi:MAG: hypothetical protein AAF845_00015 [Bacteroidota bacterium]